MKRSLMILLFLVFGIQSVLASHVLKMNINGAMGPASSNYLKEGMSLATLQNAQLILIELDTPGGLASSMREMIQEITNSKIPVIVFVSPKGAHAASAGTYLIYAAHIAAMAPGTNIGAATPVSLAPMPKMPEVNGSTKSTLEKKVLNDAKAYIKSLAQLNERNITWALQAVEKSESISSEDALSFGVIDLIAQDTHDLLDKIDGRSVSLQGKKVSIKSKGLRIEYYEADWKTKFLSIITDPNVAYFLLIIGIYGIFFELLNPGSLFPGIVGVISGVLALYALNMLPFNYAGLILIFVGISLMIAEVLIAGFGILGIGGTIAFIFGSLLLFDTQTLGTGVSIPMIIAFSLVSVGFFVFVLRFFLRSRKAEVVTGIDEMIGSTAEVIGVTKEGYRVLCHGETWSATSDSPLKIGQKVYVEKLTGLTLLVKPMKE